jgi:hypothetical protein
MTREEFKEEFAEWRTPNTYDSDFGDPPKVSGVYILVSPFRDIMNIKFDYNILYIGSAKDLLQRYGRHEVRRVLQEVYGYIQFYWKEYPNYREVERAYITRFKPKFNTQWING